MPIEVSGHDWFEFAYGQDWQRHAEFFAADHAKVLVRDNPAWTRRCARSRRTGSRRCRLGQPQPAILEVAT